MARIVVVGLTGGPCSGKSTALSVISEKIPAMTGWQVFTLKEAATHLMEQGMPLKEALRASKMEEVWVHQRGIIQWTCCNLNVMRESARVTGRNTLIAMDRPTRDGWVYQDPPFRDEHYAHLLRDAGYTPEDAFKECDAIIKLTTAAYGAEAYYTCANNHARDESLEEARALDDLIERAYLGWGHFRPVGNATGFQEKIGNVIREICGVVGVPQPLEIEKKYLLARMPDLDAFPVPYQKIHIEQTYLLPEEGEEEVRVRRRSFDGNSWVYYLTRKSMMTPSGVRTETERLLDWKEYYHLLRRRDPAAGTIRKFRYCFLWEGQYFELDAFNGVAEGPLMEIELTDAARSVVLPPFVPVRDEVTGRAYYSNREIALRHPDAATAR